MIKLCIFDMDGLLIDSERVVWVKCGLEASNEVGHPIDEKILRTLMGIGKEVYAQKVKKIMGESFPLEKYMNIMDSKTSYIMKNEIIPVKPGVIDVLEFCKKNNIKIAVASGNTKLLVNNLLSPVGILDYFDVVYGGDDVERCKPAPDIFLKPLKYFNCENDCAIVFEDGHNGMRAAKNANIRYVAVPDVALLEECDYKEAFAVLNTIDEIIPIIKKENKIK